MEENNFKISIITPSFNQGEFIKDAIESVLNQEYENFEHIIIDNCSTDQTKQVLQKYKHLVVICEPDEGQSDAINKGFKIANGDIIGWLNADDVYEKNVFQTVNKSLLGRKYEGVFSNYYFANIDLKVIKKQRSHVSVKWLSIFHCFIPSTTFFFKREIIEKGILLNKNFNICMDKDFFSRILSKGFKLKYVNMYWAKFRWHNYNKSLENNDVRSQRYDEGLSIFNNLVFNIGKSYFSKNIYILLVKLCLPIRFFLKQFSRIL